MFSPDLASRVESFLIKWGAVSSLAIFVAGYLWHHLKSSFPGIFDRKKHPRQ
jgi:hypothetical protein